MTALGRLDALVAWLARPPSPSCSYGHLVRRSRDGPQKPLAVEIGALHASDPHLGSYFRSSSILPGRAPRRKPEGRP